MRLKIGKLWDQKLKKKNTDSVNDCDNKNTFCRIEFISIYVESKQCNISYQAPHTPKRDDLFFIEENIDKLTKSIAGKTEPVNDYKHQKWCNQTKDQTKF